jgi:hypothetical protein
MIRHMGKAVACAVVLATAAPAASAPQGDEVIFVRLRHNYAVCAGFCPHFDMTVSPDGRVVSRAPPGTPRTAVYRYRVSTRKLANFRHILRPLRPRGVRRLDTVCAQAKLPDGSADALSDPRPDDVTVRWISKRSEASLTSCGYTHPRIRRVIERAVLALGAELLFGSPEGSVY